MSEPLSFGVEFEFALAYVRSPTPKPYEQETRKVEFKPLVNSGMPTYCDIFPTIRRDILETLSAAGFPVGPKITFDEEDTTMWRVGSDPSIKTCISNSKYEFQAIEICSPAYYFTPEAVAQVEEVIMLLVRTYCLHLNSSTGLHCHVSAGGSRPPFSAQTVKQLVAFLWTFEPQLLSTHPTERIIDDYYSRSMRKASVFTENFKDNHGRNPDPLEGATHFLNSTDTPRVAKDCSSRQMRKYMAYNVSNLASDYSFDDGFRDKKTVEFRGHAGCLHPLQVRAWIQTVVGIVSWAREATPSDVSALLSVAKHEIWQKQGDLRDDKRQEAMGPILAEGKFTFVDLLNHMQLYEPAAFYLGQLHKHPGYKDRYVRESTFASQFHWEYEAKESYLARRKDKQGLKQYRDSEEYAGAHEMRLLWDALTVASEALPAGLKLNLHDDDPMWPAHKEAHKPDTQPVKPKTSSWWKDSLWTQDKDAG